MLTEIYIFKGGRRGPRTLRSREDWIRPVNTLGLVLLGVLDLDQIGGEDGRVRGLLGLSLGIRAEPGSRRRDDLLRLGEEEIHEDGVQIAVPEDPVKVDVLVEEGAQLGQGRQQKKEVPETTGHCVHDGSLFLDQEEQGILDTVTESS